MASKAGFRTQTPSVNYADVRYTQADQDAFLNWLETSGVDFQEALTLLLDDLYRATFKIDVDNDCFSVAVTQQDPTKHKNSGIVFVTRASTADKGLLLAVWTIYEMYNSTPLPTASDADGVWV